MQITNDVASGNFNKTQLYFAFHRKYLGDKRTSYGRKLTFTLNMVVPPNVTSNDITSDAGDVILVGTYATHRLVAARAITPTADIQEYEASPALLQRVLAITGLHSVRCPCCQIDSTDHQVCTESQLVASASLAKTRFS